jgi:diguanylate cyclase (GGDEF)-like protein
MAAPIDPTRRRFLGTSTRIALGSAWAVQVAERIRGGVAALDLDDLVPGLRVTISLGVAALDRQDADFASLLDRADKALYRAKESGRNRIEVAAAP